MRGSETGRRSAHLVLRFSSLLFSVLLLVSGAVPDASGQAGQVPAGGDAAGIARQVAAVDQRLAAVPQRLSAIAAQQNSLDARVKSYNQRSKDVLSRLDAVSAQIEQHNAVVRGYPNGAPPQVANSMNAKASALNSQLTGLKAQANSIASEGEAVQSEQARLESQRTQVEDDRSALTAQRQQLLGQLAGALIAALAAPPSTVAQADGGDPARSSTPADPRDRGPGGDRTSNRLVGQALDGYARTRHVEVDKRPITATLTPLSVERAADADVMSLSLNRTFDGLVRKPSGTYKGLSVAAAGRTSAEQRSFDRAVADGGAVAARNGAQITVDEVEQIPADSAEDIDCPTPNSFAPDTLVLLANGRSRPIAQIRAGDLVLAADPVSGRTTAEPVLRLITGSGPKRLNRLTIAAGSGDGTLIATAKHPFWDSAGRTWAPAEELSAATSLVTPGGSGARVVANEGFWTTGTVHNLAVRGTHTFYVLAGAAPVLVHNSGCGPIPLGGSDLAQMAKRYRMEKSVSPGSNVAVFEYDTGSGPGYMTARNLPKRHSEGIIDDYIRSRGIDPGSVTRIYSERVPCSMRGFDCAIVVSKYPRAEVSFSLSGTRRENFTALAEFMRGG